MKINKTNEKSKRYVMVTPSWCKRGGKGYDGRKSKRKM